MRLCKTSDHHVLHELGILNSFLHGGRGLLQRIQLLKLPLGLPCDHVQRLHFSQNNAL